VTERVALDPHSDLSERSAESIRVRARTISLGSWGWSVLWPPRVFAGRERHGPCAFPPRRSHGIIACSSVLVRESPTLVVGIRGRLTSTLCDYEEPLDPLPGHEALADPHENSVLVWVSSGSITSDDGGPEASVGATHLEPLVCPSPVREAP